MRSLGMAEVEAEATAEAEAVDSVAEAEAVDSVAEAGSAAPEWAGMAASIPLPVASEVLLRSTAPRHSARPARRWALEWEPV